MIATRTWPLPNFIQHDRFTFFLNIDNLFGILLDLIMIPTNQTIPSGTDASFVVKTFNDEGNPLGGVPVTLTTSSGTLSTTSFSTGADGTFGPISLSEGGSNSATVDAIADVVIPQGTRYLHIGAPDTYQKLVLAVSR